jgi:hypothetical protein
MTVNMSRDHVLADAALARNQDFGGTLGGPFRHREEFLHDGAGDDDTRMLRKDIDTHCGRCRKGMHG